MLALTLGKQYYALVGKLLFQTQPDVAHELVSPYLPAAPPFTTDLSKVTRYYRAFCNLTEIPTTRTDAVMHRRLFIAVTLHLYHPSVYQQPIDGIAYRLPRGLSKALAEALGERESNVSMRIREVITWEKNYDDFKTAAAVLADALKKGERTS